jgi:hypothetical protein
MIARRCRCLIGHSNPMVARASMHASMVISSFFYMSVSRDDRMAVTKGKRERRERETQIDRRNWTVLIFRNDRIKKDKYKKLFFLLFYIID